MAYHVICRNNQQARALQDAYPGFFDGLAKDRLVKTDRDDDAEEAPLLVYDESKEAQMVTMAKTDKRLRRRQVSATSDLEDSISEDWPGSYKAPGRMDEGPRRKRKKKNSEKWEGANRVKNRNKRRI